MDSLTALMLRTDADARRVEERFNGFHDGFFRRITISSDDSFLPDGGQLCTGKLTREVEIAHNNYTGAEGDPGRVVRAVFDGVRDIALSFRGRQSEWSISKLTFHNHQRISDMGTTEPCLVARLVQNAYDEPGGWRQIQADIFAFVEGSLEELIAV